MALFIDLDSSPVSSPPGATPSTARVWLGAAHSDFASGHNLGALSTGIVITTAGVPSSIANGTNGHVLTMVGGVPTWQAASGGSPVGAQYLTLATDATLTAERVFTAGAGLTATDGGAGGNYTVQVVAADGTISVTADAVAVGVIQTANIADDAVTFAKLQNSAVSGLSVVGRGTTGAADFAEIHANNANEVLYRSGSTLAFGLLTNANLSASAAVDHSKLANLAALSVLGRSVNSSGAMAAISATAGTGLVLLEASSQLQFGQVSQFGIQDQAVTRAKISNGAANSVIGRAANSSGAVADINALNDGHLLRLDGTTLGFGTLKAGSAAGTQTDGFVLTLVSGVPTWSAAAGGGDHGALTGLGDDDHAQYALLAGRSTGQTLTGGTGSAENLTFSSTAHATKGEIRLASSTGLVLNETTGNVGLGKAPAGAGSYRLDIAMASGGSPAQISAVHGGDLAAWISSSSDARNLVCGQYSNSIGGTIAGISRNALSIIDSGNTLGLMIRVRDNAPLYITTNETARLAVLGGGALDFYAITAPSTPGSGHTYAYHDTADGAFKLKDSSGLVTVLN